MNSQKFKVALVAVVGIVVAVLSAYILGTQIRLAYASAPSGLPTTIATSSTITVGTTSVTTLFAASACSSRVITTAAQIIRLSFAVLSSTTPSETAGHLQAASTTSVYDSGLYGCGQVDARGVGFSTSVASTTITLSEGR